MTDPSGTATVREMAQLPLMIDQLGLETNVPVLALVGGAAGLTEEFRPEVSNLLAEVVVPVLEELRAAAVYGGTDAGVMRALGRARAAARATFPLVGIAPEGAVIPALGEEVPVHLEPNHTHFILVPGQAWGDESPWLFTVAATLAGQAPVATLVVNGGDVTVTDMEQSLARNIPALVVAGTGRTADLITPNSPAARTRAIATSSITHVIDVRDPTAVRDRLSALLRSARGTISR
jgi:hypothetical protein